MRIFRVLFSILVLVAVVVVVSLACLAYFVDPNNLKPILAKQVKDQTGYQLVIDGKIGWSYYPILGIKIDHMTLKAPSDPRPSIDLSNVRVAMDPMQLLKGRQQLQGKVNIGDLVLMNLHAQHFSADVQWQHKTLTLNPIKASLYSGTLEGIAHGKSFETTPKWDWNIKLNKVELGPVLTDLNGTESRLTLIGTSDITFQGNTLGKSHNQIINNMNGNTTFTIGKGLVEGIDINYFLKTADALIHKQTIAVPDDVHQTAFESFTGSAVITNGVLKSDNLLLTADAFTAKTQGTIALSTQAVDMKVLVQSQQILKSQWEIPLLLEGTLREPIVRLDMSVIQQAVTQKQVDKLKDRAKEEIKKRIPGKTGELLQNLLGN